MMRKADAITRFYPGGAPFQVGDKTKLFVDTKDGPQEYAFVTIKTLRPCSLAARRSDEGMAEAEGFAHPTSWEKNLRTLYGSALDKTAKHDKLTRVRFQIDKIVGEPEKVEAVKPNPMDIID